MTPTPLRAYSRGVHAAGIAEIIDQLTIEIHPKSEKMAIVPRRKSTDNYASGVRGSPAELGVPQLISSGLSFDRSVIPGLINPLICDAEARAGGFRKNCLPEFRGVFYDPEAPRITNRAAEICLVDVSSRTEQLDENYATYRSQRE